MEKKREVQEKQEGWSPCNTEGRAASYCSNNKRHEKFCQSKMLQHGNVL